LLTSYILSDIYRSMRFQTRAQPPQKPQPRTDKERSQRVCLAGHICLDLSVPLPAGEPKDIKSVFVPGRLTNVGNISISPGGAVANTGIVLRKLGMRPLFMARIGEDPLGRIVLDILSRHGDTKGVRVSRASSTSYSVIMASPGVDRIILHDPGANDDFGVADVDLGFVRDCRLFHFGYPPLMKTMSRNRGRELRQLFAAVSAEGIVTSLDISLPDPDHPSGRLDWAGILARTLPFVDVFAPSLDEALYVLNERSLVLRYRNGDRRRSLQGLSFYRRLADRFLAMGCGVVLLKAGAAGIYLRSGGFSRIERIADLTGRADGDWACREIMAPALRMRKIVNTTGAGDASLGGFLAALMRQRGPEQALRAAVAVGAQSLRGPDASRGVGTWSETMAILKDNPGHGRRQPVLHGSMDRRTGPDVRGGR